VSEIEDRKRSHLSLCANEDVEHHGRTRQCSTPSSIA
jgi:hypothetical protein